MNNKRDRKFAYFTVPALILVSLFLAGGYFLTNIHNDPGPLQTNTPDHFSEGNPEFFTIKTVDRPVSIDIRGRVRAENRLEIFPEAQGKILPSDKPFREGVRFQNGEPILQLDDEEVRLQLYSSRSGFQTLVSSLMPDIKLDYPERLDIFEQWFDSLHPEQPLPDVPDFNQVQLKHFLSSRGVYDRFYQIKSAESRLEKFTVRAPFTGILSSAKAEPGQTVGPQAHLGTLIDPGSYLLTATIRQSQLAFIETGSLVEVSDQARTSTWQAKVTRINPSLDTQTQMVKIYLELEGNGLREGQYLEGIFETEKSNPAAEIPKSALLRNGYVYALRNSVVQQVPVQVMDVGHTTVWVTGLNDGDDIVQDASKPAGGQVIIREDS